MVCILRCSFSEEGFQVIALILHEDLELIPVASILFFLRVFGDFPEHGDVDLVVVFVIFADDFHGIGSVVADIDRGSFFISDVFRFAVAVVVGLIHFELDFAIEGFAGGVEQVGDVFSHFRFWFGLCCVVQLEKH